MNLWFIELHAQLKNAMRLAELVFRCHVVGMVGAVGVRHRLVWPIDQRL